MARVREKPESYDRPGGLLSRANLRDPTSALAMPTHCLLIALQWVGRGLSLIVLGLFAMMLPDGWPPQSPSEWVLMAFFPGGVALGMILAWRRAVLGGAFPSGGWFLVFASPGLLPLLCWTIARHQGPGVRARFR